MKWLVHIFLTVFFSRSVNAQNTSFNSLHQLKKAKDTVFLKREKLDHSYQAIYIERNKRSTYYKYLSDFRIGKFDRYSFGESLQRIRKSHLRGAKLKGEKPFDTSGKFLPLYPYKNKLYLYSPCDYMSVGRLMITDNTVVTWFEEPYPELIKSISKEKDNTISIRVYEYSDHQKIATNNINLVGKMNKVILLTQKRSNYNNTRLYVPVEFAKKFDIIVNKCEGSKADEFEFDKVNVNDLLRLAKQY